MVIKLSNAFIFPDPEPLIFNILHEWSGIFRDLWLVKIVRYCIIKINHILYLISLFC